MDPGIICFQHCKSKIFCLNLPETCPDCKYNLTGDFSLLPFRVPYPFIRAHQHPCSIIIKPTSGDFLNDYYNCKDLHIGVTTSKGLIVEFDENGLRIHKSIEWNQCLLLDQVSIPWFEHWDKTLNDVCDEKCWTCRDYNEEHHNCYSFVLKFLQMLNHCSLSDAASSRTLFCEKFIVPKTIGAGKYISLYRKLKESLGILLHEL